MDEHHDPRRECILADLRTARLWWARELAACKLALAQIDAIGIGLTEGVIDTQCAMEEMRALGIAILMDGMDRRPAADDGKVVGMRTR